MIEIERAAFEAAGTKLHGWGKRDYDRQDSGRNTGNYTFNEQQHAWLLWLARAEIAVVLSETTPNNSPQIIEEAPSHPIIGDLSKAMINQYAARWMYFQREAEYDIYKMTSGKFRTTATFFWDSEKRERADEMSLAKDIDTSIAAIVPSAGSDTGCYRINPSELPSYMPNFFTSMEDCWDHAVLTGWRAAQPAITTAREMPDESEKSASQYAWEKVAPYLNQLMVSDEEEELPPLPAPDGDWAGDNWFTTSTLQDYARAAIAMSPNIIIRANMRKQK